MEAKIDRSSGIATPNFGVLTREPLTYFIDIISPLESFNERYICPVDEDEFSIYLTSVLDISEKEADVIFTLSMMDNATDAMCSFLNEKSKDWKLCDENNNVINQ